MSGGPPAPAPRPASAVLRSGPRAWVRRHAPTARRRSRQVPWFLTDRAIGRERLLQLIAFGIVPDEARAAAAVEAAEQARADWIREHGTAALDDEGLHSLLRSIVRDATADLSAPALLGLTSGFDSRPLLHVLNELGQTPLLYTYGQPGNIDHDVVMWLSERLGLEVALFDTRTMPFALEFYEQHARVQNASPIAPEHAAWPTALERFGRSTLIHGYPNDTLTGDNREKVKGAAQLSDRAAFRRRNDPFELQSEFDPDLLDELCPSAAVSPDRALPLYTQYDLAYRQEARIKPQPGGPHDVRMPFTDPRWVGYWLSRPAEERAGQRRWYRFVTSLRSPLFADLDGLEHLEGKELRLARKRRFYGHRGEPGLLDLSTVTSVLQREAAYPFDVVAVYDANPTFRATIDESLQRLRGRDLVHRSVIDAVQHSLARREHAAGVLANALVTIDVHVEVGAV